MQVRCLLFGRYAEVVGVASYEMEIEEGASVATVVHEFRERAPNGALVPESTMVAINREHVLPTHAVADGDELAFLPPLAGG